MDVSTRIEQALEAAVGRACLNAPPLLADAMRHAVFPGGARLRPKLCLAVAQANGRDAPAAALGVAAAIELLHCASLAHDDLPCFDDAATRRGRPSVHAAYGEPLAVLAGDGLIVLAFETAARAAAAAPKRLPLLIATLARAAGSPFGLVAGQAWESEPAPPLERYHASKTASLFVAATQCGAIAAGVDPAQWRALGEHLGEAYQVADDLMDAVGGGEECGKPTGQDAAHTRPNAVARLGVHGALARLEALIAAAVDSVPDCPGAGPLRDLVRLQATRLAPKSLTQTAA